jgi:hypothetical protein
LFDETARRGVAVCNWKSIEAAKLGHGPEFQKRIQATFGRFLNRFRSSRVRGEFTIIEGEILNDQIAKNKKHLGDLKGQIALDRK